MTIHWDSSPSPSPSPSSAPIHLHGHHHRHNHHSPESSATITSNLLPPPPPPPSQSKLPVDFSPPLIAMVVIIAAAFLVVTYSRLISRHLIPPLVTFLDRFRRRRQPPSSVNDIDSPPFGSSAAFHALSAYGLDDSAIKTLPISIFTKSDNLSNKLIIKDSSCCAVCLLEFEDNDYVRTLPVCSHAFHVDCIDIWLRSQANCPLCRAGIFVNDSPIFIPLMAARIRPSLDESLLFINSHSIIDSPLRSLSTVTTTEITPCIDESSVSISLSSPRRISNNLIDDHNGLMLLKRSYSFGFERSLGNDRMLINEPVTTSPWRYHRRSSGAGASGGGSGFWSKRLSPFATSFTKSRVFSFRHHRSAGGKYSPFFNRRRGGLGFFPLSERFSGGGGGTSSRRSKSMTSPMFMRSSVSGFSSSRLRCGDPEALLSPERYNSRR